MAHARVRRYEAPGGHEGDLNEKVENRNKGPRKKPKRNHFTLEQAERLREIFDGQLFGYQKVWAANGDKRTRMILKSRQIGATYYFAFEALLDAIETGRNQIFLSASRAQPQRLAPGMGETKARRQAGHAPAQGRCGRGGRQRWKAAC